MHHKISLLWKSLRVTRNSEALLRRPPLNDDEDQQLLPFQSLQKYIKSFSTRTQIIPNFTAGNVDCNVAIS